MYDTFGAALFAQRRPLGYRVPAEVYTYKHTYRPTRLYAPRSQSGYWTLARILIILDSYDPSRTYRWREWLGRTGFRGFISTVGKACPPIPIFS